MKQGENMPATYAHQLFGNLVFDALPDIFREKTAREKDLYNIGLQGPDILFYYHPLKSNPVSRLGHEMHQETGKVFFSKAVSALKAPDGVGEAGEASGLQPETGIADPAMIYLYGVLCHFALDSACHGYINAYEKEHGVSHCDIEGELDRYLIMQEGRDPLQEVLTKDFHPSERSAGIITPLYRGLDKKTVYKALKSFPRFHTLLYCPGSLPGNAKRNTLYAGLKLIGQYDSLRGHIISKEENPGCADSDAEILRRLQDAVPAAVKLITEFPGNMEDQAYLLNFNGERS